MDATNERHVKIMEKAARQLARERKEFVLHMMTTRGGRSYVWDILGKAHVFQTSLMIGQIDPYRVVAAEGERNLGLMILGDVMAFCPEQFVTMMQEANARDTINDSRLRRSDEDAERRDNEPPTVPEHYVDYSADSISETHRANGEYEPADGLDNEADE